MCSIDQGSAFWLVNKGQCSAPLTQVDFGWPGGGQFSMLDPFGSVVLWLFWVQVDKSIGHIDIMNHYEFVFMHIRQADCYLVLFYHCYF